jgi:hypothetical protein
VQDKKRGKRLGKKVDVSKPDAYCPEHRRVPVWWCSESYIQQKETCPELVEAKADFGKNEAKSDVKLARLVRKI